MTDELIESWAVTRQHLTTAWQLLPENPKPGEDGGTIANFELWLEHNELELALDELIDVGATNQASPGFWQALILAAENMGLKNRIAMMTRQCRS